jgi:prepilin-type N-terminal cleavage/methylation domain-containing protein
MITRLPRRWRGADDSGFSLIELVIVMSIFTMIMGIITVAIVGMMSQTRRESGQADNLDSARHVIQTLDSKVRYANDITTPATGTDGSYYVEWRSGNTGQQQTCVQWRYVPSTGLIQSRSWQPLLAGTGAGTPTAWLYQAGGISLVPGQQIWSIAATSASSTQEELTVRFVSSHGTPKTSYTSQVTLTALDTKQSTPLPSICTEVGRP